VAGQLAASQEMTQLHGVSIPLMTVTIPFGTEQKRPLEQRHSLIHYFRNNPHMQFLVQYLKLLHNNAPNNYRGLYACFYISVPLTLYVLLETVK
jgi:hypothetical protein